MAGASGCCLLFSQYEIAPLLNLVFSASCSTVSFASCRKSLSLFAKFSMIIIYFTSVKKGLTLHKSEDTIYYEQLFKKYGYLRKKIETTTA